MIYFAYVLKIQFHYFSLRISTLKFQQYQIKTITFQVKFRKTSRCWTEEAINNWKTNKHEELHVSRSLLELNHFPESHRGFQLVQPAVHHGALLVAAHVARVRLPAALLHRDELALQHGQLVRLRHGLGSDLFLVSCCTYLGVMNSICEKCFFNTKGLDKNYFGTILSVINSNNYYKNRKIYMIKTFT